MDPTAFHPAYLRWLNHNYPDIMAHIDKEKPTIKSEGNLFVCVSDHDAKNTIEGSGRTEVDALIDWEKKLQQRGSRKRHKLA